MDRKKKISSVMYLIVFVIVIVVVGAISFRNLVKFYVNKEVDYNEWTADLGNKFETDVATAFFEKFQFVNMNGAVRNLLGQQEMNGVVKLNNGYLLTTFGYVDSRTLQGYAQNVEKLNTYLKNRGTSLVYAMTPYTSDKYDPELPEGVSDFGNDDADRLVAYIKDANVDTIDFREKMHEDGVDHYSMMYRTDHHWNTEGGFYAYGVLEKYITNKTNCSADKRISDIGEYTISKYKNWHLGSRGQRTGRYYAGIDDFDLFVPNFETTIKRDDGFVGKMQDVIYDMTPLKNKKYTSRYTYDTVLGSSLNHYVNLKCKNDVKILIVSDSFAKAVNPYLIMGFSEISYVYDGDVSSITPDVIESYDPDVVILMYYPESAMNVGAYNFQGFN